MDLFILGPSNSGKSYLANFFAWQKNSPVFNLDSVQIYKHLNSLTSKPSFAQQCLEKNEIISVTNYQLPFDISKYENIKFDVYSRKNGILNLYHFDEIADLLSFLKKQFSNNEVRIKNFLFDIKEPLQSYSTIDFEKDLERITSKFKLEKSFGNFTEDSRLHTDNLKPVFEAEIDRIIVGGTIYYAYNYLFRLNDLENYEELENSKLIANDFDLENALKVLEQQDPEALMIIDTKNPRRVETAYKFILRSGRKYSDEYFRPLQLRSNFILINLWPKNREVYYQSLDKIIDSRFNRKSFEEIEFLLENYGENIIPWLQKISYEYKYFLELYFLTKQNNIQWSPQNLSFKSVQEILQKLKFKEHQYAKKQMTFMRRLEKRLT